MFPQSEFAPQIVGERLEQGARARLEASARQRRTSRRGLLRRLAAGLAAAFSSDKTPRQTTERLPGRSV
jgi:hypothetical protein